MITAEHRARPQEIPAPRRFEKIAPLLAQIWVLATLAGFVVARVLGSQKFSHLLRHFWSR